MSDGAKSRCDSVCSTDSSMSWYCEEMEKVFETAELRQWIFASCDHPETLFQCALVCKMWSIDALPVLWRGHPLNSSERMCQQGPSEDEIATRWRTPKIDVLARIFRHRQKNICKMISGSCTYDHDANTRLAYYLSLAKYLTLRISGYYDNTPTGNLDAKLVDIKRFLSSKHFQKAALRCRSTVSIEISSDLLWLYDGILSPFLHSGLRVLECSRGYVIRRGNDLHSNLIDRGIALDRISPNGRPRCEEFLNDIATGVPRLRKLSLDDKFLERVDYPFLTSFLERMNMLEWLSMHNMTHEDFSRGSRHPFASHILGRKGLRYMNVTTRITSSHIRSFRQRNSGATCFEDLVSWKGGASVSSDNPPRPPYHYDFSTVLVLLWDMRNLQRLDLNLTTFNYNSFMFKTSLLPALARFMLLEELVLDFGSAQDLHDSISLDELARLAQSWPRMQKLAIKTGEYGLSPRHYHVVPNSDDLYEIIASCMPMLRWLKLDIGSRFSVKTLFAFATSCEQLISLEISAVLDAISIEASRENLPLFPKLEEFTFGDLLWDGPIYYFEVDWQDDGITGTATGRWAVLKTLFEEMMPWLKFFDFDTQWHEEDSFLHCSYDAASASSGRREYWNSAPYHDPNPPPFDISPVLDTLELSFVE